MPIWNKQVLLTQLARLAKARRRILINDPLGVDREKLTMIEERIFTVLEKLVLDEKIRDVRNN